VIKKGIHLQGAIIKERHNYMDKESQNRYKENYENTTIKEQQERFGLNELEDE